MTYLEDLILYLNQIGLTDILLPFFLIFTITFAILQKTNFLGNKKFNVIVALVLGCAVVVPHVTNPGLYGDYDVVNIINSALPSVSLLTVAIVMIMLIIGLWGAQLEEKSGFMGLLMVVSFLAVIYIFLASAFPDIISIPTLFDNNPELLSLIIIIVVFGGIIIFITGKEPEKGAPTGLQAFADFFKAYQKPKPPTPPAG